MKKQYYIIIILLVAILGSVFYWYSYRPQQIRKNCYWKAYGPYSYVSPAMEATSDKSVKEIQDAWYLDCLMSAGLK